jgi:hypothetical protein
LTIHGKHVKLNYYMKQLIEIIHNKLQLPSVLKILNNHTFTFDHEQDVVNARVQLSVNEENELSLELSSSIMVTLSRDAEHNSTQLLSTVCNTTSELICAPFLDDGKRWYGTVPSKDKNVVKYDIALGLYLLTFAVELFEFPAKKITAYTRNEEMVREFEKTGLHIKNKIFGEWYVGFNTDYSDLLKVQSTALNRLKELSLRNIEAIYSQSTSPNP